jgi:hypothetical protein
MCRLNIKYALSTLLAGGDQAVPQAACLSIPLAGSTPVLRCTVLIITRTLPGKLPLHANATQTTNIGAQGDYTGNQP